MPELPDIAVYCEALERRIIGRSLARVDVSSPFLLRTFEPPLDACQRKSVVAIERVGKRIAIGLDDDLWLILHLMIAGRLHWKDVLDSVPQPLKRNKTDLAVFVFTGRGTGFLTLTEAGSTRRASLHVVRGRDALAEHNPGGLNVLTATLDEFIQRLTLGNHTLKRARTDPRLFSGIGNAYSDEILHAARLSPVALTGKLTVEDGALLFAAVRATMITWIERLRVEAGDGFPERVTAFRPEMAVHGRFGKPCPTCGAPVQRIRYAENETNYCARCQTNGRVLADRSLSRLLKDDWPRNIDDWE